MEPYFNEDRILLFTRKIEGLLSEIDNFKKEHTDLWKPEYRELKNSLITILSVIENNPIDADANFQELPISKYDSFTNYVYNRDINCITSIKGNNERTKTLRARRKNNECPNCGNPLALSCGTASCAHCGYVNEMKTSSQSSHLASNNTKHIYKQLDALTGMRKIPSNIVKVIDFVTVWLTDLHYIYDWLNSNGGARYTQWLNKYKKLTAECINATFFDRIIERKPENMWEYNIFKLFTDELYMMLEYATRYSNEKNSNMESLNDEMIVEIVKAFALKYKRLPVITEEFKFEGKRYEIGLYMNSLSLLHTVPEDHIKVKLERLLGCDLTMPGLMFNYREVYKKSENPPKRYCYQQEYSWIINRVFHVPFIDMPSTDREAIASIIFKFNDYYKNKAFVKQEKGCNSPLYCCTITCVFNLPYFQKYRDALKFVAVKDKGTASNIKREFFNFENDNAEFLRPYQTNRLMDGCVKYSVKEDTRERDEEGKNKSTRKGRQKGECVQKGTMRGMTKGTLKGTVKGATTPSRSPKGTVKGTVKGKRKNDHTIASMDEVEHDSERYPEHTGKCASAQSHALKGTLKGTPHNHPITQITEQTSEQSHVHDHTLRHQSIAESKDFSISDYINSYYMMGDVDVLPSDHSSRNHSEAQTEDCSSDQSSDHSFNRYEDQYSDDITFKYNDDVF